MHLNQKGTAWRGKMRFVRRFAIVALLALAFVAEPIGALCSACCPEAEAAQKLGAAMPCCTEGCAPTVSGARNSTPAVALNRASFGVPLALVTTASNALDPRAFAGMPLVFGSPSPPPDIGATSSVLRL
jgi:hypothetical protein